MPLTIGNILIINTVNKSTGKLQQCDTKNLKSSLTLFLLSYFQNNVSLKILFFCSFVLFQCRCTTTKIIRATNHNQFHNAQSRVQVIISQFRFDKRFTGFEHNFLLGWWHNARFWRKSPLYLLDVDFQTSKVICCLDNWIIFKGTWALKWLCWCTSPLSTSSPKNLVTQKPVHCASCASLEYWLWRWLYASLIEFVCSRYSCHVNACSLYYSSGYTPESIVSLI